jgi:hypothetical protein
VEDPQVALILLPGWISGLGIAEDIPGLIFVFVIGLALGSAVWLKALEERTGKRLAPGQRGRTSKQIGIW